MADYCDWCGGDHPTEAHDMGRVIRVPKRGAPDWDATIPWNEPLPSQPHPAEESDQGKKRPERPCKLANELLSYPESLGLAGIVSFTDVKSVGRFDLLHPIGADMKPLDEPPLVRDQRDGVSAARKLEWLLGMLHPEGKN
jgi:hypothetical protein